MAHQDPTIHPSLSRASSNRLSFMLKTRLLDKERPKLIYKSWTLQASNVRYDRIVSSNKKRNFLEYSLESPEFFEICKNLHLWRHWQYLTKPHKKVPKVHHFSLLRPVIDSENNFLLKWYIKKETIAATQTRGFHWNSHLQ